MRSIPRARFWLIGAIAVAALAATGSGSAATARTVKGTFGPGFTIGLTMQGKKVTSLTSVEYTGTKSFVLRLKKGSYRFVCDPHSGIMHGRFQVS